MKTYSELKPLAESKLLHLIGIGANKYRLIENGNGAILCNGVALAEVEKVIYEYVLNKTLR